jgi:hypothetical protein
MLSEDMARNPMALVQAQARPSIAGVVHPTVDGMTPDDPGFRKKIPPPAPMSPIELEAIEEEKRRQEAASRIVQGPGASSSSASPGVASPSTYRLLVTCSRSEDHMTVGLESPPDWDVIQSWTMPTSAVRCVAIVCRALGVRIKDMTGGELGVPDARLPVDQGPAIPDSNLHGPRDLARNLSDVRGAGADHASQPVGRPDPSGEGGVRALDPEQTVEFLEEARRRFEEGVAEKAREEEPNGGEAPSAPPDDRENALRRRLSLPEVPSGFSPLWFGPGDPYGPPVGPDPVVDGEAPPQPE